eukprot:TRINITY_DN2926_c0_g1_i1.p1 TRINITY_DN2926_c0_g1~~TRINITY_DN2926_c0_g1_i1.p1  ORF type:complete len:392 (-),score=110.18 TRINITY_DN2926_c0_g1_i1:17-1165(-)
MPLLTFSLPISSEKSENVFIKELTQLLSPHTKLIIKKYPNFAFGNLDSLLALADDMAKASLNFQNLCYRLEKAIYDLKKEQILQSNLPINDEALRHIEVELDNVSMSVEDYFYGLDWSKSDYNPGITPQSIFSKLQQEFTSIDEEFKVFPQSISQLKAQLTQMERQLRGPLTTRALDDLIPQNLFINKEFIVSVFIVVPLRDQEKFLNNYALLDENIVPESAIEIFKDKNHYLYRVVLFKQILQSVKDKCRDNGWRLREYVPPIEKNVNFEEKFNELKKKVTKKTNDFQYFSIAAFSEALTLLYHLNHLRLFIESVLTYGPPHQTSHNSFLSAMCEINTKNESRIKESLHNTFNYLQTGIELDPTDILEGIVNIEFLLHAKL